MQSSAKSPIFKLLAAFGIVVGMLLSPVSAAPLTNEQKDALRDYFDANDKIASFGSKPLELLDKPGLNDFFEQYGDALLLVRIGNDLQGANDWDALKKVFEKLGDVGIKKLANLDPSIASFASAFGWFGWAKTGMELVKKFAYDPGVTSLALQMYSARRQEGAEPSDAVVNIPFGPMRALAQEEFFKNYNKDLLLEPGSKDKMRPEWEAKLDQFLNSWMEDLYQQSLAEKAKQALVAKATEAKTQVPGLEKQLLDLLGGSTGLVPDESVALLLDASGSMDEQGRMVAAKASARQVIGQMTGKVEVALIVFYECGDVRVAAEFTTDPAPLLAALEPVAPSGGTPLAEGISFAKEYLRTKGKGASRRLVVLTDGAESCSGDLLGAARK